MDFPTLNALTREWDARWRGATVAGAWTQSPKELTLALDLASGEEGSGKMEEERGNGASGGTQPGTRNPKPGTTDARGETDAFRALCDGGLAMVWRQGGGGRQRRNTTDVLPEIVGRTVEAGRGGMGDAGWRDGQRRITRTGLWRQRPGHGVRAFGDGVFVPILSVSSVASAMRLALVLLLALSSAASAQTPEASGAVRSEQVGTLVGTVIEADGKLSVPLANVFLPEIQRGVVADSLGRFEMAGIPVGTWVVIVSFPRFERAYVEGVEIVEGVTLNLDVELRPGVYCWGLICDCFNHLIFRDAYTYRSILAETYDPDPCACDCTEGTITLQSLPTAR